ncbi:MarR family winged helix-turn-helix transcriptional regulator [Nocardia sp. NPDC051052]|uniref:MarR family winged helix-turn-helix transcriptional regulator n=1 Tax=Nocardia sp. NPDC051052 TaxID=3364322 RepID=UPI0037A3FC60
MPPPGIGAQVAEAIAELLRRRTREGIYAELTQGMDPAVDTATYPVLSALARWGPRSAAALAAEIGLDRSVTSRHATRLEQAGLLRRTPDPDDARATLLSLTGDGEQAVEAMRERLAGRLDRHLAAWPEHEARAFATALTRFVHEQPFG